jgi:hypothetical protein
MTLAGGDGFDAMALHLAEGIGFGRFDGDVGHDSSLRWNYPVQVHAVGASPSQPQRPLPVVLLRNRTTFPGKRGRDVSSR